MKFRVNPRDVVLDLLPQGSVGAEVGVHLGNYSDRILKIVRPSELNLIDPWKAQSEDHLQDSLYATKLVSQNVMNERFESVRRRFSEEKAVRIHRKFSSEAATQFPDEYFDWVYLDGDHSYAGVSSDISLFGPKVKRGGHLIGDDYTLTGWWKRGVVDAFAEAISGKDYMVALKLGAQIALQKT